MGRKFHELVHPCTVVDFGTVTLQTAAILAPVAGAVWQVYSGRRSTHASEIARIEEAIATASTRDPLLAKAYRAHALKRLSDFHGRPGNAGVGAALWAMIALGIFALIPSATGWSALFLTAAFLLSLLLASSNYGKLEYRHQIWDGETHGALERALIHAREDLVQHVDDSTPITTRKTVAGSAAESIQGWSRQNKAPLATLSALVVASFVAVNYLGDALEERRIGFEQTVTWTAWFLSVALVSYAAIAPGIQNALIRLVSGRMRAWLRYLVPISVAAAAFTWLPTPLASFLRQVLVHDPGTTWRDVATMVVALHSAALLAVVGPSVYRMRRWLKGKFTATDPPLTGAG